MILQMKLRLILISTIFFTTTIIKAQKELKNPRPFNFKHISTGGKSTFGHQQTRDQNTAKGEYRTILPDGRVQIVSYIADENGYRADVSYEPSSNVRIEKEKGVKKRKITTNNLLDPLFDNEIDSIPVSTSKSIISTQFVTPIPNNIRPTDSGKTPHVITPTPVPFNTGGQQFEPDIIHIKPKAHITTPKPLRIWQPPASNSISFDDLQTTPIFAPTPTPFVLRNDFNPLNSDIIHIKPRPHNPHLYSNFNKPKSKTVPRLKFFPTVTPAQKVNTFPEYKTINRITQQSPVVTTLVPVPVSTTPLPKFSNAALIKKFRSMNALMEKQSKTFTKMSQKKEQVNNLSNKIFSFEPQRKGKAIKVHVPKKVLIRKRPNSLHHQNTNSKSLLTPTPKLVTTPQNQIRFSKSPISIDLLSVKDKKDPRRKPAYFVKLPKHLKDTKQPLALFVKTQLGKNLQPTTLKFKRIQAKRKIHKLKKMRQDPHIFSQIPTALPLKHQNSRMPIVQDDFRSRQIITPKPSLQSNSVTRAIRFVSDEPKFVTHPPFRATTYVDNIPVIPIFHSKRLVPRKPLSNFIPMPRDKVFEPSLDSRPFLLKENFHGPKTIINSHGHPQFSTHPYVMSTTALPRFSSSPIAFSPTVIPVSNDIDQSYLSNHNGHKWIPNS